MDKVWPPRFLLRGGPRSPRGSFGEGFRIPVQLEGGGVFETAVGAELTTNGVFAADTDWTKDAGWAIAGGDADATNTAAGAFLHQAVTVTAGKTYRITYTISAYTSGNVAWSFDNGQVGTAQSALGTYTEVFILSSAATELRFGRVTINFTGSIDDVSLRQLGP